MNEIDRQIEAAWRAASRDQPPVALDDSIRAAARRAVAAAPGKKPKSWWRVKTHWLPLAAAAAVAVIAFGIIQLSPEEQITPTMIAEQSPLPHGVGTDASKLPPPDAVEQDMRRPAPEPFAAPPARRDRGSATDPIAKQRAEEERQVAAAPERALAPSSKAGAATSGKALTHSEPFPAQQSDVAGNNPTVTTPAAAPRLSAIPPSEAPSEAYGQLGAQTENKQARSELSKPAAVGTTQAKNAAPRPAEEWIVLIRRLRSEGKTDEAAKELQAFRAAYKEQAEQLLPADLREPKQ